MWNDALWNEEMWNDSGTSEIVSPVVDTIDAGVSFTISDELGGFDETISDELQ